ncbi:MAG: hypothetical protein OXU50_02030 [Gammaproteobacteria bacterium]|nr:hypothetical protein [Gammaproteobacteria bacterium]
MSKDYERYHGIVIRSLVTHLPEGVHIQCKDIHGIANCFQINQNTGLLIKHSSSRRSPWVFSFTGDNLAELELLSGESPKATFVALVCGWDGFLILSEAELKDLADRKNVESSLSIHVKRGKHKMYSVGGRKKLKRQKQKGFSQDFFQCLEN